MKRLIYALVAASTLGLAAGSLAIAADEEQNGTVVQAPADGVTQDSAPAPQGVVKEGDEDKSEGSDTKQDGDDK